MSSGASPGRRCARRRAAARRRGCCSRMRAPIAGVLDLDGRQAVKFHPSKTPAEYVGEARLDASGRASLADLVARLYRHLFGAVPCDERAYREFAAEAELVFQHVAAA